MPYVNFILSDQKRINVFKLCPWIYGTETPGGEDYWKIIDSALDEQTVGIAYREEAKIAYVSSLPLAITLILNKAEVEDWEGSKILQYLFRFYERNCSCCTGTNCNESEKRTVFFLHFNIP